jgi:putative ABC transport system permease protein
LSDKLIDYQIKIRRNKNNQLGRFWIWKLAFKDARYNFNRLFLFVSSIVIGIAALVAINSFNINLQQDINNQSKELLGSDLVIESNNKSFDTPFVESLDSLEYPMSSDVRFASMVFFPKNKGTRLIQVIALEGAFPFYGSVELLNEGNFKGLYKSRAAMIDESLATQYNIQVNDSLKLGNAKYQITGIVSKFPGNTNISAAFAPAVYIPYQTLESTGLIQFGSRYNYNKYLKVPDEQLQALIESLEPKLKKYGYSFDTVESRKQNLGQGFQNLYRFFNLLTFVALILGSIGVASSVHIYIREKRDSAAILRCLGASGWQIFYVFFIQIVFFGFLGTLLGVLHGLGIQLLLPFVVKDFLPVAVTISLHWQPVLEGFVIGLIMSTLFAFLPLSSIRLIPPLSLLRSTVEGIKKKSKFKTLIIILIIFFPWLFAVFQSSSWINGTLFYAGLLATFGCLWLISKASIYLIKKYFPAKFNFVWRQSLANLFRPNNQTTILIVVIGLGAFLISVMTLIQNSLLEQVEFVGSGERSNTVIFDIQPGQKEGVVDLVKKFDLPIQQLVPVVTTRMHSIKGKTVKEWQEDTSRQMPNWALTREYRVTYRDSLIVSEELTQGKLYPDKSDIEDSIFVSIETGMAERMQLKLKDELVFNVQGVPLKTYVGSIREVDWQRIQTNFMVVFPTGALEQAPQFNVLVTRIDDREVSARLQQDLVKQFPNVSAIDLTLILDTLDNIFDKVAMVIRFMALFSVVTGLFVLSGAVINSKYARLKDNVLLRTIGATRKQLTQMTLIEYAYLGILAALTGSLLALIASWALSIFFFKILFFPDFITLFIIWIAIITLTIAIGWINTRSVLNKPPLVILRKEV